VIFVLGDSASEKPDEVLGIPHEKNARRSKSILCWNETVLMWEDERQIEPTLGGEGCTETWTLRPLVGRANRARPDVVESWVATSRCQNARADAVHYVKVLWAYFSGKNL